MDLSFSYSHGSEIPTNPNSTITIQMDGQPLEAYYDEVDAARTVLRFDDPNGFGGWAYHCRL